MTKEVWRHNAFDASISTMLVVEKAQGRITFARSHSNQLGPSLKATGALARHTNSQFRKVNIIEQLIADWLRQQADERTQDQVQDIVNDCIGTWKGNEDKNEGNRIIVVQVNEFV